MFCALNSQNKLSIEKLVEILSDKTRVFLNSDISSIEEGNEAELTLFDPSLDFEFDSKQKKENQLYSPFMNEKLKGKVLGVVNNNKLILNH